MKIVFLTRDDPRDIKNWSGTLFYIYNKLKEKHIVEIIGTEILQQFNLFSKHNYYSEKNTPIYRYLQKLNRLLSERINLLDFDLVFFGDLYFLPLEIDIPMVVFSDMTYEQVIKHYVTPNKKYVETCYKLEKALLTHVPRIIYCSEWIKQKAIDFYEIDSNKIDIIEFGANISTPINYAVDINMDICRLVFIGINWERKGGDKLMQVYELLKRDGFLCTLTIIGAGNKEFDRRDNNLIVHPFLDKANPTDLHKMAEILSESHFLILPTKFDAFGIVFCEASAYALPSITADVGGVGQAVINGKNGYLLPADAIAQDYADKIKTIFSDAEGYLKLRASSRYEFETRLTWDVWGEKIDRILEDVVSNWKEKLVAT